MAESSGSVANAATLSSRIGIVTTHENINRSSTTDKPNISKRSFYDQEYWIESEVILIVLTVLAVYIFICISLYTSKRKVKTTRDSIGQKQGKQLYIMLVLGSGFAVLRMISDHVVAFTSSYSDKFCFATIATSTILYAFGLLSVYIFLWMRQSIFYANPVLVKVLNRAVTLASWCTLILMLIAAVCLTILYNVPAVNGWDYQVTEDGCKGVLTGSDEAVAAIATAATSTFQVLLLGLFLYPLLSRKTQKYRSAGNKPCENGPNRPSLSNTDENATDGDNSTSTRQNSKYKIERPRNSENESGIDVQEPADSPKSSKSCNEEMKSQQNENGTHNSDKDSSSTNEKRKSLFSTPKFTQPGRIFYRRNNNEKADGEDSNNERNLNKKISSDSTGVSSKDRDARPDSSSTGKEKRARMRRIKRTQQGRRMMAYLKKSFGLMVICIITDIASTVIQAEIDLPEIVYLVIFDINLMINIICIVMSFRDWDVILLPACTRLARRKPRNSYVTDRSNNSGGDKRRAEALRSVTNGRASPKLTSPARDSTVPYDPLPGEKKL